VYRWIDEPWPVRAYSVAVQIVSENCRHRITGSESYDAAHLPAAEHLPDRSGLALEEWECVRGRQHETVRLIETAQSAQASRSLFIADEKIGVAAADKSRLRTGVDVLRPRVAAAQAETAGEMLCVYRLKRVVIAPLI